MAARLVPVNWVFLAGFTGSSLAVGLLAGVDPRFAIAASIAIAFVLIVFADLTVGLALFGFFSFLELLSLGGILSISKLGGGLLALSWIAFVVTHQEARSDFFTVHPGMSLVLGTFLGWVLLSSLWAENTGAVVATFGRFFLNVVLYVIVFSAIRDKRQVKIVISGLLAGVVAAGIYGMFFAPSGPGVGYEGRLSGTNLDPNQLASVLVAGSALAIGLWSTLQRQPMLRLAMIFTSGFCVIATILTGSRGGMIALGVMLVAAILFSGRWRPRIALISVLVALSAVAYISTLAPSYVRERIAHSRGEDRLQEGRSTLWEIGQRMVRAHPVEGVGAGNFMTVSRHYLLQPGAVYRSDVVILTPQVAHNTYLEIAAELGVIGLVLYGSIALFSVGSSLKAARIFGEVGDYANEALARSVAVGLVGILAADFFISDEINKQLWLILGIGPAILTVAVRSRAAARDS
jgi:O-antigen ligase